MGKKQVKGEEKRLAAVDVGTNSIRCIVVEMREGGFRVLDDEKATVRLGEGLYESGFISPAAWDRAREALGRMRKIVDGLGVSHVEAVATSAVRTAKNGAEFVRAMEEETGIRIKTIGPQKEAALAALSALYHFNMDTARYVMVDIGGGSVEIVLGAGGHTEEIFSLDLGAVLLTEKYLGKDPIPKKDFKKLRKAIAGRLRKALGKSDFSPQYFIGSGGTFTTIGSMVMASRKEKYNTVHAYEVLHSDVVHLLARLRTLGCRERGGLPGLSPERADIIVAGVAVVDQLMRFFDINTLKVNERGIREGLIIKSLRKHRILPRKDEKRDWRGAVEAFGRTCHVDENHARHTAFLALQIFDALEELREFDGRSRELLEAAALLHDTGYWISYPKHHKHSYHLIRHADLYDFSPREKELIANTARYHRRGLPKGRHENLAILNDADRDLVAKLGGILKLADGLDRRRTQQVVKVKCRLEKKALTIHLEGRGDLSVEVYGALSKRDLFEKAFGLKLELTTGKPARGRKKKVPGKVTK